MLQQKACLVLLPVVLSLSALPASRTVSVGLALSRVTWQNSESLLEALKGVNATEELKRVFRFDATEGDWAELRSLTLHYPTARSLVLMTDTRKLARENFPLMREGAVPYWTSSVFINLLYAMRHRYDFLRIELPEKGLLRHSSWYKLQVIRVLLERYDWLLYLDSDAFFLSQQHTLESLVSEFDLRGEKHLLLPENGLCCETANTGVMLWRNSAEAQHILKDWW